MEGKGESKHYVLNPEGFSELFDNRTQIRDGVLLHSDVEGLKDLPFGVSNLISPRKGFLLTPTQKLMKVIKSEEGLKFQISYQQSLRSFSLILRCPTLLQNT